MKLLINLFFNFLYKSNKEISSFMLLVASLTLCELNTSLMQSELNSITTVVSNSLEMAQINKNFFYKLQQLYTVMK